MTGESVPVSKGLLSALPEDTPRRLQDRLTELSAGRLRLELSGTELRPGPREDI